MLSAGSGGHSQEEMRDFLRSAVVLAFLGGVSAAGQDLRVVAELPLVPMPLAPLAGIGGETSVRPLAAGGPPFVVCVGPTVVNVWPVGRASEPVVSVLPVPDAYGYGLSP